MTEIKAQGKSIFKKVVTSFPGVVRIKVIKDLLLSKLDELTTKVNILNSKSDLSLENDSALIPGVTKVIEAIEHNNRAMTEILHKVTTSYSTAEQQTQNLSQEIKAIQTYLTTSYSTAEQQTQNLSQEIKTIQEEIQNIQNIQTENRNSYQSIQDSLAKVENHTNHILVVNHPNIPDPEVSLMAYLYSFLPHRKAIDVGANIGDVSEALMKAGYDVYAFEPFPSTFKKLSTRFYDIEQFHGLQLALGETDTLKDFFIAEDQSPDKKYQDSSLYNSLIKHSMPDDLQFVDSIPVTVRSLESLHAANELPNDIDLIKIDTEGYDLEVIKGMGEQHYSVIVAEFWDQHCPFGQKNALNALADMTQEMRTKGYHWYLTIYRVWGSDEISFYCNSPETVESSWGNVFYFRDHSIFMQAMNWCSSTLKCTYFR